MKSDSGEAEHAIPRVLQLLNAFLTVQSIHVAAVLGIADQLVDGPKDIAHLANATNANRKLSSGMRQSASDISESPS